MAFPLFPDRLEAVKRRSFLATSSAAFAATAFSNCNKASGGTLHLFSWADYIDLKLVATFEQKFNCKVVIDTFDSNEALYAKLTAGATGYDVLVPSSYMVKSLVRAGLILPLDHSKIPNISHVDAAYLKHALDPQMTHSVPYMMSCTCLAWLSSKVAGPVPSYEMLDRADLKGRITLLDDMREVLGAALFSLGHPLNTTDPALLALARDVARRWKTQIAKFDSEQYKSGIASGEFHLVQGYASDLLQVADENADIVVRIPREGAAFSCDDLCIFKGAKNVQLAHQFIDFMTTPANAAQNMQEIKSHTPNSSAYPLLDADFRSNPAIFPDEATMAKCQPIDDLGDGLEIWSKTWDEVKAP